MLNSLATICSMLNKIDLIVAVAVAVAVGLVYFEVVCYVLIEPSCGLSIV